MSDFKLQNYAKRFPWPKSRPNLRAIDWTLDAGGRQIVVDQIKRRNISLVLEIGVFVGGSVKTWLNASSNVTVIAVDHWESGDWLAPFALKQKQPEWVIHQLSENVDSLYQSFLASTWEYRHRIIPVRQKALPAIRQLHRLGIRPELIFLDADKTGREIELCHEYFPQATICGDDWFMGEDRFLNPDLGYPIRRPVKEFCQAGNWNLVTDRHTWLITKEEIPFSYKVKTFRNKLKSLRRRFRGLYRWAIGRNNLLFSEPSQSTSRSLSEKRNAA